MSNLSEADHQDDLITVIIPNYNNAHFLEKCIESVIQQTYRNLEIIISDDGSTDNSIDILRKYEEKDSRIRLFLNNKNVGVSRNRHQAIMLSRGLFLSTLDSDDVFYSEDKLEQEYNLLLEKWQSGIKNVITFSRIVILDEHDNFLGYQNNTIKEGELLDAIVKRSCMIPRDFLFTKEQYIRAGGYKFYLPIYEDWDLKIRLAANNSFFYSQVDGIGYRRHGKGLSHTSPFRHVFWLNFIFLRNFHLLRTKRLNTSKCFYQFLWRILKK
jgi:glycosyltransferase involved in cell wall biosynthesis